MPRIGAFFDVDRTLVACNTGRLFLRDLRRRGEISFLRALRAMGWMAKYHLSLIDLQVIAARVAEQMRGKSESEFAERCRRWVEDEVLPLVVPGALRQIERHRAEGHVLAVLSSSPTYVDAARSRRCSGIEEVLSTHLRGRGRPLHGTPRRTGLRRPRQDPLGRGAGRAARGRPRAELVLHRLVHRHADARARGEPGRSSTPIRGCGIAAKKRGWPVQDWSKPPIEVRA